jgi:DNA-binding NarL/FixJ family response regulator
MAEKRRIIITDNYPTLRSEIRTLLEGSGLFTVVGEATNGAELLDLLLTGIETDALILDLMMPVMTGIEAAGEIRKKGFSFGILVLTMHNETELLCRAFRAGVTGYMLKDGIAKELIPALHAVIAGKIYLSPAIKLDLPNNCNVKICDGRVPGVDFVHCTA